jgi:type VI secretion system secreted protein Hcp
MNKTILASIIVCSALFVAGQAGVGFLLPNASAAVDYFLKIEGVEGESKDSKHTNWIELESINFAISTKGSGGGGGAGKASFSDFNFIKKIDKSSPVLLVESASGKHFPTAELAVVNDGKEVLKYKFKDVLISSYQISADEEIPVEMVSLGLASIEATYGTVTAGWDIKANKSMTGSTESAKTTTETKKETSDKPSTTKTTPPTTAQPAARTPADSDGDGVTDDKDKCPAEAETKNSYQDDDGCADRVPATTTVPKTVTPVTPKIVVPLK